MLEEIGLVFGVVSFVGGVMLLYGASSVFSPAATISPEVPSHELNP